MVRPVDGKLHLENVGLNSCVVGDEEVLGGQSAVFEPGAKVRIWPYTLTFEAERAAAVTRSELETHLRSIVAELELRIHRKLLERLDLYEFEARRGSDAASILLLENNIDDVCRDLGVFAAENEALLEEITGLTLRDHLVNQLILETGDGRVFRPGRLDQQRVRRAGHAGSRARGRIARPVAVRSPAARFARVPRRDRTGAPRGEPIPRRVSTWSVRTCTTSCASISSCARSRRT